MTDRIEWQEPQKPVMTTCVLCVKRETDTPGGVHGQYSAATPKDLLAAGFVPAAKGAEEPVGWTLRYPDGSFWRAGDTEGTMHRTEQPRTVPVYASPPSQQGATADCDSCPVDDAVCDKVLIENRTLHKRVAELDKQQDDVALALWATLKNAGIKPIPAEFVDDIREIAGQRDAANARAEKAESAIGLLRDFAAGGDVHFVAHAGDSHGAVVAIDALRKRLALNQDVTGAAELWNRAAKGTADAAEAERALCRALDRFHASLPRPGQERTCDDYDTEYVLDAMAAAAVNQPHAKGCETCGLCGWYSPTGCRQPIMWSTPACSRYQSDRLESPAKPAAEPVVLCTPVPEAVQRVVEAARLIGKQHDERCLDVCVCVLCKAVRALDKGGAP